MNDRPNILIVMTDQHRGDYLSIEDHPVLITPNMDNIGGQGVRFSRAYTPCPACMPARRSFMSGQFPTTHGLFGNKSGAKWDAPLTLPQVLRNAGYHTCLVGRDMHQFSRRRRFGFDQMITLDEYKRWVVPRVPDIYIRKNSEGEFQDGMFHTSGVMHNDWTARPWHLDETLHPTNWTVNEALKFLDDRDPSCPVFLVTSFIAPHPPLVPPAFYMERYLRMDIPEPVIGDWEQPLQMTARGMMYPPKESSLREKGLKTAGQLIMVR